MVARVRVAEKKSTKTKKKTKVIVLVRPAKKCAWWPKDGKNYAWATVGYKDGGYAGFTVGRELEYAVNEKDALAVIEAWLQERVADDSHKAYKKTLAAWVFVAEEV